MADHGRKATGGFVYPDSEPFGKTGPCLPALQQAYYEEHGVLPGPELTKELLDKWWEAQLGDNAEQGVGGLDGGVRAQQPGAPLTEPRKPDSHTSANSYAQAVDMRVGRLRFAENRLDLVPFLGASPAEVYSRHLPVSQSAPTMGRQYVCNSFHQTTTNPVPINQAARGLAPQPAASGPYPGQHVAAPHHGGGGVSQSRVNALPAANQAAHDKAIVKSGNTKDLWLPGEIDRVNYLREVERRSWAEIFQILGRHTESSITDKYYSSKRRAKGGK